MRILLSLTLCITVFTLNGQEYKNMMQDLSINFYDVVEEAERYFEENGKGKGTGYNPFQRWVYRNEPLYYPSGDRSKLDAYKMVSDFERIRKSSFQSQRSSSSANVWKDLGPYVVDSVTGGYSPGLGRVESVYADPDDENKLYLASRSGGFWRSFNGGATWENTTDDLPVSGASLMDVHPDDSDDIIINLRNALNGVTHGVYRSFDGGSNWSVTPFNPTETGLGGFGTDEVVRELIFHPLQPDTIFIATSDGLWRSIDNFVSVQQVRTGNINDVIVHPTNPDIVYLTINYQPNRNKVYRSTDGGNNFVIVADITANNNKAAKLHTTKDNPDAVFFSSGSGVWKSIDQGINFTFIPGSDQYGSTFAVSDDDENVLLLGVLDIYRSDDNGANWIQSTEWNLNGATPTNYVHADFRSYRFINGKFYIGTDGYMCVTTDNGITWEILSNGTGIRENYKLGQSQSHNDIVSCGSQDNGSSYLKNGQWIEWYGADGMEQIIHPNNPDYVIGNVQNGGKRRSKNGVLSQQGINSHESIDFYWVAPLAYSPTDFNTIYSVGTKLVRSENFGSNWTTLHDFGSKVRRFAIAENNSDIMLASETEKLFKSTDGGVLFSQIGTGVLPNYFIFDIAFDPEDDDTFILVYNQWEDNDQRIYITHDGGANFTNISYNLSAIPARSVVIDHSNDKNIYIGTETGVFVKTMSETSYSLFGTGLPPVAVYEMEINYAANTIKAATWGRGLWETKLKDRDDWVQIKTIDFSINGAEGITENNGPQLRMSTDNPNNVGEMYIMYSVNNMNLDQNMEVLRLNNEEYFSKENLPATSNGDEVYFKVFAVSTNGDTTESYRFVYDVVEKPDYCNAQGSSGTGSDYITRVSVDDQRNDSGKTQYSDFTHILFDVDQYDTVEIMIRLNFSFALDQAGAWVDWNDNGVFEEEESIAMSAFQNHESFGQLIAPLGVSAGEYRLRTRVSYTSNPIDPCGTVAGEVEDYTINLLSACADPPMVNNLNDALTGSLRWWLDNTCTGDTIHFSEELVGDTLIIYNAPLENMSVMTIRGHESENFTISGGQQRGLLSIQQPLNLINVNLINAKTFTDGGAFVNHSTVTLRNVYFENNFEGNQLKAFTNYDTIEILPGTTVVKE